MSVRPCGAVTYDNQAALGGLVPFTIIAVLVFFTSLVLQVQRCRHFKQLLQARPPARRPFIPSDTLYTLYYHFMAVPTK